MNFPLPLGIERIGLPVIITSGKLKNLCFLIDTGSDSNHIFDFVYNHFRDEFKPLDAKVRIAGIEGNFREFPLVEATFGFEGKDYTSVFSVTNAGNASKIIQDETGIQIHGILGTRFFLENKWIIDFETMSVRCNESNKND